MLGFLQASIVVIDVVVVAYLAIFFAINFTFVIASGRRIRRALSRRSLRSETEDESSQFMPTLSLLVPAYNEELTCAESIRSLLGLRYPNYEIIICNDGSTDGTVEALREAFGFERYDVDYRDELVTAPIRGLYRASIPLPKQVKRLVLIDKENGGKADAMNAALNACQGTYVASMDADSLLEPTALLHVMQSVADAPEQVAAVGAQVGISNGSTIEGGSVTRLRLPKTWIARFQVAEYMRSFAQSRTALSSFNSLLILSGVFAVFRRDLLLAAGGFLTERVEGRVVNEYCGAGSQTVCEDMEIVVRLHRYLADHGRPEQITFVPHPAAWTEAPEAYRDLGKQRGRWYRGLLEVLWFHRPLIFNPRFGRIGMFALPYQMLFEALAPLIEAVGYVTVPLTVLTGLLAPQYAVAFLFLAIALNVALSTMSVLLCLHEQRNVAGSNVLFSYGRARDAGNLLLAGFLSNFGYRQFLLFWQLKGLRDFLRGRKEWDKFARRGYGVSS
jgi:cellulose synthase/poly-beta-1,6-N-acetylglucosamine synthase-like glycosyltransferase